MFHIIKMRNRYKVIRKKGEKMFKKRKNPSRRDVNAKAINEKLLQIERQAININAYINIEPFGSNEFIVHYTDSDLTFTSYEIENMSVEEIVRKIEIVAGRYGYAK